MLFVPIKDLSVKNKIAVERFLLQYEKYCVQLSATIKRNIADFYVVYNDELFAKKIFGIFCVKKTILHIFPYFSFENVDSTDLIREDFINSFVIFYKAHNFLNPLCINGEKKSSEVLLECFEKLFIKPVCVNKYNLLECKEKEFLLNLKKEVRKSEKLVQCEIIRCKKDISPKNYAEILNLQIQYEKEEVVPSSFNFNEDLCCLRFSNSLKNQIIFALKNQDGKFVCKAGTNAIGFKNVQLGGVFTLKEYRKNGFATVILKNLIFSLLKSKRKIVLFVNNQNVLAQKLYNSLSFNKISDYLIAYFDHNL